MDDQQYNLKDPELIKDMLIGSGYSPVAVDYYLKQEHLGKLDDADQVTELTGHCGDTMKVFLKIEEGRIADAKIQVLGCPGAVASAMAAMEMVRGLTVDEAMSLKDGQVYQKIEQLPDQKQHCVRLSVKTLQKALEEYMGKNRPAA